MAGLQLEHRPEDHYEVLHREAHGVVLLWEALAADKRWVKLKPGDPAIPIYLSGLAGQGEVFLSVNQFDGWRLVRLLRSLRAVYVDLDGYTDLEGALDALESAGMPAPSVAVWSGRGMHLYWLLEPAPAQALPVWQRIEDRLIEALRPLGADPAARDCTRVLRVVGTLHVDAGEIVRGLILTGYRWPLRQLAFEVLGPRRRPAEVRDLKAQAARRRRQTPQTVRGSIYERWYKVYGDLVTIGDHHRRIPIGSRDKFLFLTAVALSWFSRAEALQHEIQSAARTWTPDLPPREVAAIARLIQRRAEAAAAGQVVEWQGERVDPRYRFRRDTLYAWLRELIPDLLLPRLRAILPDRVWRERKADYMRDYMQDWAGYESAYTGQGVREDRLPLKAEAEMLRAQGLSLRAIAAQLGVGKTTIARWLAR